MSAVGPGFRADVLIVLGAALAPDGSPGPALAFRLETAAAAHQRGDAPFILLTGAGETGAMLDRLRALGIPPAALLVEPTARDTRQNALAAAAMLRARGLRRALIVTQPFHMRRALACFRRVGVECQPLASESPAISMSLALRERVASLLYRLRGWS